jgi:uncharacterized protein YcbX
MALRVKVGEVEALFRYPVKSMRGELLEGADLGWHGLDGDRRLAFRRATIAAVSLADRLHASGADSLCSAAAGPAAGGRSRRTFARRKERSWRFSARNLASGVGRRHGSPVEMMHLNRGIFDEASISVITSATVGEIGRLAAQRPDVRRFRPNILIASLRSFPSRRTNGWEAFSRSEKPARPPPSASPIATSAARW